MANSTLVLEQELQGRVVGRNKDDANFICKGLEVLAREWEALQGSVQRTQECPLQVFEFFADLKNMVLCI